MDRNSSNGKGLGPQGSGRRNPRHVCRICGREFDRREGLLSHAINMHDGRARQATEGPMSHAATRNVQLRAGLHAQLTALHLGQPTAPHPSQPVAPRPSQLAIAGPDQPTAAGLIQSATAGPAQSYQPRQDHTSSVIDTSHGQGGSRPGRGNTNGATYQSSTQSSVSQAADASATSSDGVQGSNAALGSSAPPPGGVATASDSNADAISASGSSTIKTEEQNVQSSPGRQRISFEDILNLQPVSPEDRLAMAARLGATTTDITAATTQPSGHPARRGEVLPGSLRHTTYRNVLGPVHATRISRPPTRAETAPPTSRMRDALTQSFAEGGHASGTPVAPQSLPEMHVVGNNVMIRADSGELHLMSRREVESVYGVSFSNHTPAAPRSGAGPASGSLYAHTTAQSSGMPPQAQQPASQLFHYDGDPASSHFHGGPPQFSPQRPPVGYQRHSMHPVPSQYYAGNQHAAPFASQLHHRTAHTGMMPHPPAVVRAWAAHDWNHRWAGPLGAAPAMMPQDGGTPLLHAPVPRYGGEIGNLGVEDDQSTCDDVADSVERS